jgi:hypothetical protein
MKLSVEAKVAAAIAAAFVGLTMGAIARGNGAGQTDGSDGYGPANNPGVNRHMNEQGYNGSLPGRTNTGENRQKPISG